MSAKQVCGCPVCGKKVIPTREQKFFPFCSEFCKLVDLDNWLEGRYTIPGERLSKDTDVVSGL